MTIYVYVYLEPKLPLFLKGNPLKQGLFKEMPLGTLPEQKAQLPSGRLT